jgi:hypothetical protein
MAPPVPPPKLVLAIVGAARDLTKHKRPPYWIAVDTVMERLRLTDRAPVDEAIRYAVDHHFLRAVGRSPKSVVVTAEGVRLVAKK